MAQDNIIMAFRKRLSKRGYTDISIYRLHADQYQVTAREPLANQTVVVRLKRMQMHYLMRK